MNPAYHLIDGSIPYTQGKQGKNPPKHLTPPPLIPECFLGREADLTAIHQKLAADNLLLLVNEQGGIGKTTLAAKYWEKHQDQYQHLAWVYAGNGLLDALLTLTQPLEMTFYPLLLRDEPYFLSQKECLPHLLTVLRRLKKMVLLVIDNLSDSSELMYFYDELRFCQNVHFLVTTRTIYAEKMGVHPIQALDVALANDLFLYHFPKHPNSQQRLMLQVLEALDYNTLVIKILAKTLHTLNRQEPGYHLNSMLHDLQNKGVLELRQTKDSKAEKSTWLHKEAPEAILEALYNLGKLSEGEKKLLAVFAVLPAEPFKFAILALLLDQIENLEKHLWSLVEKGWLDHEPEQFCFRVSPVVQALMLGKKVTLRERCQELIEGLNFQLQQLGQDKTNNAGHFQTNRYVQYARSVEACFVEMDDDLSILRDGLDSFYFNTGSAQIALHRYKITREIEEQRYKNDPEDVFVKNRLCVVHLDIGKTYNVLNEMDLTFNCYKKAIQLGRELCRKYPDNPDFKSNLAIAHWMLGDLNYKLSNFQAARGDYKAAERLWKELVILFPDQVEFCENLEKMRTRITKLRVSGTIGGKTFELLATIFDYLSRGRYR